MKEEYFDFFAMSSRREKEEGERERDSVCVSLCEHGGRGGLTAC